MPPISESTDFPINLPCGCRVIFLASSNHGRERMEPCSLHSGDRWYVWRIHATAEARERLGAMKRQRR